MSVIAAPLRFGRARVCSRESSCEPPIACSGVTVSTRREPTQEASQVVSTTPTIGTSSTRVVPAVVDVGQHVGRDRDPDDGDRERGADDGTAERRRSRRPGGLRARQPAAGREALEPISRSRAIVRARPATIVAKVLAVTIAPT